MSEIYNSTNVQRETTNGLNNIARAGLFVRFVALIVDLAIMAFVFFGLLIFTQNVICQNSSYVINARDEFYGYNVDSGLFVKDEEKGGFKERSFEDYKGYQDMFYSYYTDYLVNKCPEKYRVNYDGKENYWFNVHVLGQPDDRALYDDVSKLNQLVTSTGPVLFTYKLDGENNPLYDEIALPVCQNNDPSALISEEEQARLIKYFYTEVDENGNQNCYYVIASQDLVNRGFVSNAYNNWYMHYYQLPIAFCFAFSMLIFFFIVPIIFRNGETLGKLMFHLCLVNKLGYRYSRLQLIPRFFFMLAVVMVAYFIFGLSLIFLGIVTFIALASYGLAIFTKDHKAIHDYIAGTIVANKTHSEIFDNANMEAKVKASINEVKPLLSEVETPRDDSILYKNENFDNKNNNEG